MSPGSHSKGLTQLECQCSCVFAINTEPNKSCDINCSTNDNLMESCILGFY